MEPTRFSFASSGGPSIPTPEQLKIEIEQARRLNKQLNDENLRLQRDYYAYIQTSNFYENKDLEGKDDRLLQEAFQRVLQKVEEYREEKAKVTEDYDRAILELQRKMHQKDQILQEIKDSLTVYKQEVALDAEFTRSGKRIPRTEVEAWINREALRDLEIHEWRLRNIRLQNQLAKQTSGQQNSDSAKRQAHMINYEQLKIENQTYNERIEERTEELQKLRKKINITVQILSHFKEKLQFVTRENQELKRRSAALEMGTTEQRDLLSKLKRDRDHLKSENARLKQESGLVGIEELLRDFQMRKKTVRAMYARLIALLERHEQLSGEHPPLLDKVRAEKEAEDRKAKEEDDEDATPQGQEEEGETGPLIPSS